MNKEYWVIRSAKPTRNLCSDGVIRKNLKHATDGVTYMKFRDEPSSKEWYQKLKKEDNDHDYLTCRPLKISEYDYHSLRTGKVHHNLLRNFNIDELFEL